MLELARTLVRKVDPGPGRRVALALPNAQLHDCVAGLLDTAGAEVVSEGGAHACVVQIMGVARSVPRESRVAIDLVSTGGRVLAVALDGTANAPIDDLTTYWRPRLRCEGLEVERVGAAAAMCGRRAALMSNQYRKRLRVIGHGLDASVLVGRAGLSPEVIDATETALLRHGIVKVKLTSVCTLDKSEALADLAWAAGAEAVHRVGKTCVLFRADVALDPPIKRGGRR